MKAGTTSLHRYLSAHSQVLMSEPKELDFFVEEKAWSLGWEWYTSHFKGGGSSIRHRGESSTNYTKYPRFGGVPFRVKQRAPDLKFIYLVRNPVERAVSHVLHRWGSQMQPGSMRHDIVEPHVVACSSYAMQLEQYLQHFASEQILIVFSEDLLNNKESTMQRVLAFLDIDNEEMPPGLDTNHGATVTDDLVLSVICGRLPSGTQLPSDVRRCLAKQLVPDLRRLQAIVCDTALPDLTSRHIDSWMQNLAT